MDNSQVVPHTSSSGTPHTDPEVANSAIESDINAPSTSSGAVSPRTQPTRHQPLSINTGQESRSNSGERSPYSKPRTLSSLGPTPTAPDQTAPISITSPRGRNRGYSLRRQLFSRNVPEEGQIDDGGSASSPSSPQGSNIEMRPVPRSAKKIVPAETVDEFSEDGMESYNGSKIILPRYHDMIGPQNSSSWKLHTKAKEGGEKARKFILRIKDIPPSKNGRRIPLRLQARGEAPLIDERTKMPYIDNTIRSSRYTLWDFFPRQLVAQFMKLANFYFLCVSILQMIPTLSTTGSYTTIAPLMVFISISMGKEGYDDYRRYKQDKIENKNTTKVLNKDEKEDQIEETTDVVKWQKIRVGDIIRLDRDDACPADLVILGTGAPNGIAYVETAALDGETNLKIVQALPFAAECCERLSSLQNGEVTVEDPNPDLYNFDGKIAIGDETRPLTNSQVIYRGSVLRNTPYLLGIVVFSGEEAKIRMNANKSPRIKAPGLQFAVNRVVVLIVFFVLFLTIYHTVGYKLWQDSTEKHSWYLINAAVPFFPVFSAFLIMFNTLIPLSLYVSLEIIKVGQMFLMNDIDMYDEASDTPMEARTSTINEELGQVSYIFTDKTGTLTDNSMVFRKISIAGYAWLHDNGVTENQAEKEHIWHKRRHRDKGKNKASKKDQQKLEGTTDLAKGLPSPPNLSTAATPTQRQSMNPDHMQSSAAYPAQRRSMQLDQLRSPSEARTSMSAWRSSALPERPQRQMSTRDLLEYLQYHSHTFYARKARMFLLSLALCHTCLPETDETGDIKYQAASPDEVALVQAAKELDFVVIDRTIGTVTLKTYPNGQHDLPVEEIYQILDVIEFSSKRKRMSIIVRFPNQKICIISKGADSTMIELLRLRELAKSKLSEIERRANTKKSIEVTQAIRRASTQRQSFQMVANRASMHANSRKSFAGRPSLGDRQISGEGGPSLEGWLRDRQRGVEFISPDNDSLYSRPSGQFSNRHSLAMGEPASPSERDLSEDIIDERIAVDDSLVFERCLQHVQDFSVEGLRTLLYGYRYLDDEEYTAWKMSYTEATTSLVNRQQMVEEAAEVIELRLELAGATAIEDKLQQGVPEAIDKLRRANIKLWMLTGDKRETAINIGHSCRLIKDYSEVTVLDKEKDGLEDQLRNAILKYRTMEVAHSVIVIDGATLAQVDENELLQALFFELTVSVDSVICCRASPAQKAALVRSIRKKVRKSVTLAIGDGANDIAMIQEAHVGIGITGKEGLAAARSSDYSIAQFRFLLKLLLVHGRWNYVRTCKYVLGTFWKEMLFYLTQAIYQRYNGYTGTSLYESWSISMFNTLFTSLPVIFMGVFEKDLAASTLLAVPELYVYNRKSLFNVKTYLEWIFMASAQAVILFFSTYGLYGRPLNEQYNDIFAFGLIVFTACIILISVKLQGIEMHSKSVMALISFVLSVGGWFMWNCALSVFYKDQQPVYVRGGISHRFGRQLFWWSTLLLVVSAALVFNLMIAAVRVNFWPNEVDQFQAIEKDPELRKRLEEAASDELQQGWNRGSKKTSLEIEREREIQELLDKPRIMDGQGHDSVAINERVAGSSTVDSPSKKRDSTSVSVVELRERRKSRDLEAGEPIDEI